MAEIINRFKSQTAVAIITCNREHVFQKCIDSIDRDAVGQIYVINAGDRYSKYPDDVKVIQPKRNPSPVGINKNIALREMKNAGYEFLFLMEDDVKIKDNKAFEVYIETAMDSGIWGGQLSFALHGGFAAGNLNDDGTPKKKMTVQYTKHKVDFYHHGPHAFAIYHSNVLPHIGYFDERYINSAEHLDQYLMTYYKNLGMPFWWFPDVYDSFNYLEDVDENLNESVIRKQADFTKNFSYSWGLFKEKHRFFPHEVPSSSPEEAHERMEFLEKNYAQKQMLNV
jgi:hypothetical protein